MFGVVDAIDCTYISLKFFHMQEALSDSIVNTTILQFLSYSRVTCEISWRLVCIARVFSCLTVLVVFCFFVLSFFKKI